MKQGDINGLKDESPRFGKMLDSFRNIPAGELANLTLKEFVTTVSEYLPQDLRQEYCQQSPKLQEYIKSPDSSFLRGLYGF